MSNQSEAGPRESRPIPVDWEALEDAFENNAAEVHSYLHLGTGEVLRVVEGIADPIMHARVAADPAYLRVEPVSSREQYRWMERFIPSVEDAELNAQLRSAIDGKGAFRRFKDVLGLHAAERERWFRFRSERLRVFIESWLVAHAVVAIVRPAPAPEELPSTALPTPEARLAARRVRSAELLRQELSEVLLHMGSRDLDKVLSFAEFLRARRSARGFAGRLQAPLGEAAADLARESREGRGSTEGDDQ
jgi:hypothetical protein